MIDERRRHGQTNAPVLPQCHDFDILADLRVQLLERARIQGILRLEDQALGLGQRRA